MVLRDSCEDWINDSPTKLRRARSLKQSQVNMSNHRVKNTEIYWIGKTVRKDRNET